MEGIILLSPRSSVLVSPEWHTTDMTVKDLERHLSRVLEANNSWCCKEGLRSGGGGEGCLVRPDEQVRPVFSGGREAAEARRPGLEMIRGYSVACVGQEVWVMWVVCGIRSARGQCCGRVAG